MKLRITTLLMTLSLLPGLALLPIASRAQAQPALAVPERHERNRRSVDCDKGEKVTRVLQQATAGDTIRVKGTCQETLTITTDGVTLDGGGTAVLDNGGQNVLTVEHARKVMLTGLTVRNGARGIRVLGGATAAIRNTTVTDNRAQGLEIASSQAELSDTTVQNNGLIGVQIVESATVHFTGTVSIHHNNGWGMVILGNSSLSGFFGAAATLRLHHNNRDGLAAIGGSQIALLAAGQVLDSYDNAGSGLVLASNASLLALFGSKVDARNNRAHGLALFASAALNASDGASLTANDNALNGVLIAQGATLGVTNFLRLVPAPLLIETSNNGRHGLEVSAGASLAVDSATLTSSNNTGTGLLVDDGSRKERYETTNHDIIHHTEPAARPRAVATAIYRCSQNCAQACDA